ncbi:hypothetical protein K438DRAFT_1762571 [Mycena galopus ATCC 62051]|nr:hypothetical protein K438DRAFT_1762571 [Mycena galopus ATCC 62051]
MNNITINTEMSVVKVDHSSIKIITALSPYPSQNCVRPTESGTEIRIRVRITHQCTFWPTLAFLAASKFVQLPKISGTLCARLRFPDVLPLPNPILESPNKFQNARKYYMPARPFLQGIGPSRALGRFWEAPKSNEPGFEAIGTELKALEGKDRGKGN